MATKPLFSIVIPTYNRAEKLRRALHSLDRQLTRDFEIIICDDGSTDHTKKIVEEYLKKHPVQYIYEDNWGGPARPRNNGIKAAEGDWICFLDADDWWYPNKLNIISKYLDSADIIHHDLDLYASRGKLPFRKSKGRHLKTPVFVDLMINGGINTSSAVVRKTMLERLGGFVEDKRLIAVEDYDLWLRMSKVTERFIYISRSLGAYWLGDNITEVSERQVERIQCVYSRYLESLSECDKEQSLATMHYSIARIYQQLGRQDKAVKSFLVALRTKRFDIGLRTVIRMLQCLIKRASVV